MFFSSKQRRTCYPTQAGKLSCSKRTEYSRSIGRWRSRMKACSSGHRCFSCSLATDGANRALGRLRNFGPLFESGLNRPQHNYFGDGQCIVYFQTIQNNLEVIRVQRIALPFLARTLIAIGSVSARCCSLGYLPKSGCCAKHYHKSVPPLSWSLAFYLLLSFQYLHWHGHNCGRYQSLYPPLRRADHVSAYRSAQWHRYSLFSLVTGFLFARDLAQYPTAMAPFSGT